MTAPVPPAPDRTFRCPASVRWLPRVLAAAMIAAALVLASRIDPAGRIPNSRVMKGLLVAAAAVVGLRIVLSFGDLGLEAEVRGPDLLLVLKGRTVAIPWEEILRLDWDPPFRNNSRWTPALVVVDRKARRFRIPALIEDGGRFLSDVLDRSGRAELADWASAQRLAGRMATARFWVVAGYLVAAGVVAAAAAAPL